MRNSVLCYLEDTVEKFPDKVAIVDIDKEITFKELKRRGLCIANSIHNIKKMRHNPILVYLPKSVESIMTFVGILYSGNFYVPTDVRFPFEKVNNIIARLEPKLIITDTKNANKLISQGISRDILLNLDEVDFSLENLDSSEFINKIIDTDPVYTFFTSGSTGVPKGVTITNRNVIDYIDWASEIFQINENTVMGNQSPFYFDISTQDIYSCFKTGATLVIIPEVYFAFPVKALQFINEKKINFLYWVPSAFINISNFKLLEKLPIDGVKTIMFGGEVMPVKHLNYWRKYLPNLELIANVYGPTEATVNCTYYIVNREFNDNESLPIGFPCFNTDLMVLDDNLQLIMEPDVVGELFIRGSSLSVGYWNDPEKTNEMFIQNPLNNHYEEKIYRTGDLVYYNQRGELIFVGRKDFQIKHLGYRIELGEIETAVLSINGVGNACALYDNKQQEIVLFYTTNSEEIDDTYIRNVLSEVLPKYMIPTKYYKMKVMPMNDNGKIDRRKLKEQYI